MHHDRTRHVRSRDGTEIAYHRGGVGPPLLLVHGSLGDHTRWDALRPWLEPFATVYAVDRRGRGASSDGREYAIEREYEDVAAVIDAIAHESDAPIDVYCSSFGGLCTFGAAQRTTNIARLALYEAWPPLHPDAFATPLPLVLRMESLLAEGRASEALELAYAEIVGLNGDEIARLRAASSWSNRVAAAHTVPREIRAFASVSFDAAAAARITAPTLVLVGSESPQWRPEAEAVAAALPNARVAVLEGQGHAADVLAPERVAERLLAFLRS